jgi:arylsulfatase A-like enzyme
MKTTACLCLLATAVTGAFAAHGAGSSNPSILIITVDALRADRLSCYGYERPTSPTIDELLARGVRFENAWTVEPLTNPSLTSLLTSLPPHEHGATRNGLRSKAGLTSLPKTLRSSGWDTAAFVASWTLKDELSRLGEHFDHYEGVYTRRRWFGIFNREATGADVTERALEWVRRQRQTAENRPFLLWVHYVEPHAPYRFHRDSARTLGISKKTARRSDRYDTEVHAVDREIGTLLDGVYELQSDKNVLVALTADHGESLGEHDYWGHGRHLYEPSLHIPLGLIWPGNIEPAVLSDHAVIIDLSPTILELIGLTPPQEFRGSSWANRLHGAPAQDRPPLCFQAHKGAVKLNRDSDRARSKGLLEVGVVHGSFKEILELRKGRRHLVFDFKRDPDERQNLASDWENESHVLMECFAEITQGLGNLDHLSTTRLSKENREKLKALGYIEE